MKGLKRITKVISNSVSRIEESEVEHYFSNHPHFTITPLSSTGLAGATTCSAYDPVLGILAIGTRSGIIHILGRDNLECTVSLPHPDVPSSNTPSPAGVVKSARSASDGHSPVSSKGILMKTSMEGLVAEPKAMVLQPATATLACIDTVNRILVFDLSTGECVHHARIHEGQALTLELGAPGSPWLYIGCTNGRTAVFSIDKRWMSSYLISSQAVLPMMPVVALGIHPFEPNLLLIVYYDGSLVVWDLPTRKVHFKPTSVNWPTLTPANTSPTHATCAAWHPDGSQIVVGYDNGWLAFWTLGSSSTTPTGVFPVPSDQPDGSPGPEFDMACPVFKLIWSLEGERAVVYVGGGLSDHTIVRLDYPRSVKPITARPPLVHVIRHSPVFGRVSDFVLLSSMPWIPTNPRAVITLSDLGDAIAYDVTTPSAARGGQLQQFALPVTLALGTMGNVKSVSHQYVHPDAMNDIMDLQAQCNTLVSQVPLGWSQCYPDSIAPGVRVPEHALATLITTSGVHVLDLTSSPPAKLPGLFVPFELIKAVIIDHLPGSIVEDPTLLAEWHVGLKLAWAEVDWKVPRMVVGCENGMLIEMLCRKNMVAGTEAEGKRVRVRSLNELDVDGGIMAGKDEAASLPGLTSSGCATAPAPKSGDDAANNADVARGGEGDEAQNALPAIKPALHTSATDVSTWIPLALTRTQFHAFRDRIFLPYRIMIPKRPTRTNHAALLDGMLAVMAADGTVDVFDTHAEVHVTQLALGPICDEIARDMASEQAKKGGKRMLSQSRLVSTDPEGMEDETNCKPTCVKWHRGMDDTLRLLIGCSGHVFVYALEDESMELQTCLRDKGDVPVLDVVLIPDVEAYEAAARMQVATQKRKASQHSDGLKHDASKSRIVPLASGEEKGSGVLVKPKAKAEEEEHLHPMLNEPTMVVVTRDSVRVLDLDDFKKLHSWKPNLERHGHVVKVQPLNNPTTPTASQANLLGSRRSPNSARDDCTHDLQIMVVTEIAVVILNYPYLEFVADMSHGVKALDKDRIATTLDAHLLHAEGDNRMHVLGCRKDTSWAVHPRLHLPRPEAANAGATKQDKDAEMEGMLMPAPGASRAIPLAPLPPRPPQPQSMLGSLLSYLPFGGSDTSASAAATGVDKLSAQDAAIAKQLNDVFGVVDQASVGANAAAHRAMDALKQRGEKLELLEHKFSELNEGSSQFAKMAKQIRDAEEKKKWYHF